MNRTENSEVMPVANAVAEVISDQNGTMISSTRRGPNRSASHPPGTWPIA